MFLPLKRTSDISIQDNMIFMNKICIGKPIEVTVDGVKAIDKTRDDGEIPTLRPYEYYGIVEYYVYNNVIITNLNLFGHNVKVEYYTLPENVKLVFKFHSFGGEPPAIEDIKITDD